MKNWNFTGNFPIKVIYQKILHLRQNKTGKITKINSLIPLIKSVSTYFFSLQNLLLFIYFIPQPNHCFQCGHRRSKQKLCFDTAMQRRIISPFLFPLWLYGSHYLFTFVNVDVRCDASSLMGRGASVTHSRGGQIGTLWMLSLSWKEHHHHYVCAATQIKSKCFGYHQLTPRQYTVHTCDG